MLDLKKITDKWTLFLDRDGVLNYEKPEDYIYNYKEFIFYEGVKDALKYFAHRFPLIILTLAGISVVKGFGTSAITNPGPHGLSQILYAFTSSAGNNGSAFAGIGPINTPWYDTATGITTLVGRFFMIIPMLAIAGNLAQKKYVPPSLGTFPVTTPLFTLLLISVILILGALTFFPALSLGPILEHLLMHVGKTF